MPGSWLVAGLFASALMTLLGVTACERSPAADDAESRFATNAASLGALEGQLAAGALYHASSQPVREFAAGIIDEHRRFYRGLEKAAQRVRLQLPDGMIQEHQDAYIRVTALRGEVFDRAYLEATIEEEEQALAAFNVEAARPHSEFATWAEDMVPELERHVARARELAAGESTVAAARLDR
jgi:putative membrane protein